MTKPIAHFTSLLDRAAFEHLQSKTFLPSFSHYDVWLYEHAVGFTVAKMMDADLLADTKASLEHAMQSGEPYHQFVKKMKPYLMARGWWGEQIMTDPIDGIAKVVQLGSTRRLRVIFQTNMATAYAAGQWARIQENKREFPYLKYISSTAEQKRASHMTYYGKIWRVDEPIWQSIFPPNGYGCQCTVRQLTAKQALRERGEDIANYPDRYTEQQKANHAKGIIDDGTDWIQWREFINPRTGQTVKVPFDVTPTFAHNHASRLAEIQKLSSQRHGKGWVQAIAKKLHVYLQSKKAAAHFSQDTIFANSASIIQEGKRLYEQYADMMQDAIWSETPHEGILEILRSEGVALGGDVHINGSNPKLIKEMKQALQVYPSAWLQRSNQSGALWVEFDDLREFHYIPDLSTPRKIKEVLSDEDCRSIWQHIQTGAFKHGDAMIISNPTSFLNIRISTHIHEFGHHLQQVMPELDQLFERLFKERTQKDTIQKLNDMIGKKLYEDNEIGMRDDFPDEYYGKIYDRNRNKPMALEMLTMTFEALLGGQTQRFNDILKKPDFLYFGLAILTRFKP